MLDIDGDEVAHEVVAGIGAGDRQAGENQAGDAAQVARQELADILLEDVERRTSVERHDDVAIGLAHLVRRPDRRATLRQSGGDADFRGEQNAGETALDDTAGDLQRRCARRAQPADEKCRAARRQRLQRLRERRLAWIAVDDAERRRAFPQPCRHLAGEALEIVADRGEEVERRLRQGGNHDGEAGPVEGLDAAGANADPDAADPIGDAGALAQEGEDAGEIGDERIGGIKEAEIGAIRQWRELRQTRSRKRVPGSIRRMRSAKRGHPSFPAAAAAPPSRAST